MADVLGAKMQNAPMLAFASGVAGKESTMKSDHKALRDILLAKGFRIVDEFQCKGFNTNSILQYIGSMNKERPNAGDLAAARAFAQRLPTLI